MGSNGYWSLYYRYHLSLLTHTVSMNAGCGLNLMFARGMRPLGVVNQIMGLLKVEE
jgi:hypothetical protein